MDQDALWQVWLKFRSIHISLISLFPKGLTATIIKDTRTSELVLHGGAFVQANNVKQIYSKHIIYWKHI